MSKMIMLAAAAAVAGTATLAPALPALLANVWARLPRLASGVNRRAPGGGTVTARDLAAMLPDGVLMAGSDAVSRFLDRNHVSHVESVRNNPGRAASSSNLVFEPRVANLARGGADMTRFQRLRLGFRNMGSGLVAARARTLASAARGAKIGALVELPVAAVEEVLHYLNRRKTGAKTVRDGAVSVGTVALTGAAAAAALHTGAALGVTVGGAVLAPVAVVGGVVYTGFAAKRIWDAVSEDTREAVLAESGQCLDMTREVTAAAGRWAEDVARGSRERGRRAWESFVAALDPRIPAVPAAISRSVRVRPPQVVLTSTSRTLYAPPFDDPDDLRGYIRAELGQR